MVLSSPVMTGMVARERRMDFDPSAVPLPMERPLKALPFGMPVRAPGPGRACHRKDGLPPQALRCRDQLNLMKKLLDMAGSGR